MNTLLVISGKNWKLSLAELTAYLKAREFKFQIQSFSKEFFSINVEGEYDSVAIDDLGGIIKIGKATAKLPTAVVKEAFLEENKEAQKQLISGISNSEIAAEMAQNAQGKVFFGVSVYCAESQLRSLSGFMQRFVGSAVRDELKAFGKKSQFMGFSKERKLAQLSHVEVLKKKLVETKAELLLCIGKEESWFATTIAVHNPFEFQKRDLYKPRQRKIFGMPPRLAKIMVNLSYCKPGKVLLDPFCGVGTVLSEALLSGAGVVGVDINVWCVKAAIENLEWLTREYSLKDVDFRVVQGDVKVLASKVGQEMVDCIVTEPDLGPALRQVPTTPYAHKVIEKLEPLFYGFVQEAFKVLKEGGRLVLVTPYFISRSGEAVSMPIVEKAKEAGFIQVAPFLKEDFSETHTQELLDLTSLLEVDERHIVGREINVFKK